MAKHSPTRVERGADPGANSRPDAWPRATGFANQVPQCYLTSGEANWHTDNIRLVGSGSFEPGIFGSESVGGDEFRDSSGNWRRWSCGALLGPYPNWKGVTNLSSDAYVVSREDVLGIDML